MSSRSLWSIAALAPLALRLLLIADQPYTDEGVYAADAYLIHLYYTGALQADGWILPREGTLNLYPLLSSWVFSLPFPPFLMLRLLDALFAAAATAAVYRFLCDAVGERRVALVSALLFTIAINHPVVINAGFKNSITPAMGMTALALLALQRCTARRCVLAGLSMSAAVLFREFFLPLGLIVSLYALGRGGWACFRRFVLAGSVLAVGVVLTILWLRGDGAIAGLVTGYIELGTPFDSDTALREANTAFRILLPLLPTAAMGLLTPLLPTNRLEQRSIVLYLLGVGLVVAPAVEIAYKQPFAYHFAMSILGLTILSALGLRALIVSMPRMRRARPSVGAALALCFVAGNALLLSAHVRDYYVHFRSAIRFIPVMVLGDWTDPIANRSIYLRAARTIREHTSPSATMTVNSNAIGLLPLTGRRPTAVAAGSIHRILLRRDRDAGSKEAERLARDPPDVLVLITRGHEQAGPESGLDSLFPRNLTASYRQRIFQGPGLSPYGAWSAEIFLR